MVAFQNLAKAPKKKQVHVHVCTTDDPDLKIYG